MMGRALLVLGWLATLGLIATGIIGFQVGPDVGVGTHLLLGLMSSLLLLFSHSWIMFYLIGTGKAIKSAVVENDLDESFVEMTRDFKNQSYPWLMLAMIAAMTTFILGGGVATKVLPAWIHSGLFFATLAIQLKTLWLEGRVLLANERLMKRVASLVPVL